MSDNERRKNIVEDYIRAYNDFDVEKMLKNMDERVVFRNIAGGAVNLKTEGIEEFRKQAAQAAGFFSQREQKITGVRFGENTVEVEISYRGTVAVDLPNGLKQGDKIELNGRSIFRFAGDKIIEIEDIS